MAENTHLFRNTAESLKKCFRVLTSPKDVRELSNEESYAKEEVLDICGTIYQVIGEPEEDSAYWASPDYDDELDSDFYLPNDSKEQSSKNIRSDIDKVSEQLEWLYDCLVTAKYVENGYQIFELSNITRIVFPDPDNLALDFVKNNFFTDSIKTQKEKIDE